MAATTTQFGTPDSEPYWTALDKGELWLQRCADCDAAQFYPTSVCRTCRSRRLNWQPAQGTAEIVSHSTVRRAPIPVFKPDVPYVVAIVRLSEGPTMLCRAPEGVSVGLQGRLRVRMGEDPQDRSRLLVEFQP